MSLKTPSLPRERLAEFDYLRAMAIAMVASNLRSRYEQLDPILHPQSIHAQKLLFIICHQYPIL